MGTELASALPMIEDQAAPHLIYSPMDALPYQEPLQHSPSILGLFGHNTLMTSLLQPTMDECTQPSYLSYQH